MTKPAAISGYLVDIRNLGYEKSIVLKITVPAELAMSVMEIFGWPTSVDPVSVAIARLNENRKGVIEDIPKASPETDTPPRSDVGGPTSDGASVPDKKRRTPVALEKRLAQQAGICCSDPVFQKFLFDEEGIAVCNEAFSAAHVRYICGVKSRSEILPNTAAGRQWDGLYSRFIAWREVPEMSDT